MNDSEKQIKIKTFVVFALISLLLMGLDRKNLLSWPKARFEYLFKPIQRRVYTFNQSIIEWKQYFSAQQKESYIILEQEKQALQQKVSVLQTENNQLKQENISMRHLLGTPLSPDWKFLPGQVLNYDQHTLLIDRGSTKGVKQGMVVVLGSKDYQRGLLIGRIEKVNPLNSVVRLPSHPESSVPAELLNGGEGVVSGKVNGELQMEKVLQEVELREKQLVITSGREGGYPPDLLIGEVKTVSKQESEIYQEAVLQSLVNYKQVDKVFVVSTKESGFK
jgi:rod shape-determining protein MreC